MTVFFLDRNMPPKLVGLFETLGLNAIHHNFLFTPFAGDDEIIAFVAKRDYVLVTYDRRMAHAHKIALRKHNPRVVFLTSVVGDRGIDMQIQWYKSTWMRVCNRLVNFAPQTQVRVAVGGDIRVVWEPGLEQDKNEQQTGTT